MKNKKVGLALGSGGMRGLSHIGVLKALIKENIPIDFLAGSSAGAIIGAYFALYGEIESLEKTILEMTKKQYYFQFVDPVSPKKALVKGKKTERFLNILFKKKFFPSIKTPFTAVATDLKTGKEIHLKTGSIAKVVMASMTFPGIFAPVKFKNYLLVDGGITNPTPISAVKKMGADIAIGVDLTFINKVSLKNPNTIKTVSRSVDILMSQVAKSGIGNGNHTIIIRPNINKRMNPIFGFNNKQEIIQKGEKAAKKAIPEIKKLLLVTK